MPRTYPDGPIAVYRMYSERGVLLYVGQSVNPAQRLCLHRTEPGKNWLTDVARMDLEWFQTREAARDAEAAAIASEGPQYNIDHQVDAKQRRTERRSARTRQFRATSEAA